MSALLHHNSCAITYNVSQWLSMPKVVDVDERRAALIAATSQEISRHGLANVTLRSIARLGGWTTGIVTHYFDDKEALLKATFRHRADRARLQIEQALADGATLLDASIDAALPLDAERMLDWRVFLAYMGASIGEEDLRALHHERQRRFLATLEAALDDEVAAQRLPLGLDTAHEAARLLVVLNGIAVVAALAADLWPPEAQRSIVEAHLACLRATEPTEVPNTRRRAR